MRTSTTLPALLLLAGALTACGDDGAASAPDDASKAEFCDAYATQVKELAQLDPSADTGEAVERMKSWADQMEQIGTPGEMPDDARQGFEIILGEMQDLDPGASQKEFDALGDDLGKDAEKQVKAFGKYAVTACPEAFEEMMGDLDEQMGEQMDELEGQLGDLEGELGENLDELTESPAG